MKNLKERIITSFLYIILLSLFSGFYITYKSKYKDCGIIIDKYSKTNTYKQYKYGVRNKNIFIIKYSSDNYIEEIRANANDYYKNEIGSKVCYRRTDPKLESVGLIMVIVSTIVGIFFSATMLLYIATKNNEN